ncbi:CBS domain-containing protein [Candidatus Bathyarchaeota archaeon]|jgi:CBS domain-containing protein|nr:CBS domain-containing protein [Candidatus Bathyarchaeota archaeon]MBT4319131.1 CBS domain-containing protein [Candidatus Bathyarchaeota archaeon]MBT4423455.1 CBS domain-containing protein [Candidatus Bathyarchaeota archaeon]MBT5641978.1 CBS domain-containing protein [Candidatus Bathyarchaeota archaeon]MBT6605411.1 CBS domain-containing protein [Candidatus Bathyarchaeota archaeon]
MSKEYSEFCTLPCKVLMNKAPPIAQAKENLVGLTNRLLDIDYKVVVVYEDGEPIGLVTLKDIMKWLVRSEDKEGILKDLITVPLIMVSQDSPLEDALNLMDKYDIKHIGVHEDKVLKGLVTQNSVKEMCELYPHYLRQYIVT